MIFLLTLCKQQHFRVPVLHGELLLAQTTHVCWQSMALSGAGETTDTDQLEWQVVINLTLYR
jgi:hypothetical protein